MDAGKGMGRYWDDVRWGKFCSGHPNRCREDDVPVFVARKPLDELLVLGEQWVLGASRGRLSRALK